MNGLLRRRLVAALVVALSMAGAVAVALIIAPSANAGIQGLVTPVPFSCGGISAGGGRPIAYTPS